MRVDRRAFVAGATLLTVAPTLPLLPILPSAPVANTGVVVFLIDGWSTRGDGAGEVWIRVDHSWRSAWR